MAAGDLTNLDDVKAWLKITSNTDDALLTTLITAASKAMQTFMNRTIASQAYTETRNGVGGCRMSFANYPVTAVASVTVGLTVILPAASFGSAGYRFTDRQLVLTGYEFCRGFANVVLGYTAGFDTVPEDLAQAAKELIGMRYRERDRIGQKSKIIDKETITFNTADMPDDVKLILNNYKKVIQG